MATRAGQQSTRMRTLRILQRMQLSSVELAELLRLEPSHASHLLRRLHKNGLCSRERIADGTHRGYRYTLTAEVIL